MAVEITADGEIPEVVRLPQTGVYVGVSDVPAPVIEHIYVRVEDVEGQVSYQYQQRSRGLIARVRPDRVAAASVQRF